MKKLSFFVALLFAIILALDIKLPILAETQYPVTPDAVDQKTGANPWLESAPLPNSVAGEVKSTEKPETPLGSGSVIRQSSGEVNLLPIDSAALASFASLNDVEQLIQNGGFESDEAWTTSNTARTTAEAVSGSWSMGSTAAFDGDFYQAVTFPSDVISATLDYYWKNDPPDVEGETDCYDYRYNEIWDESFSNLIGFGPINCKGDTDWHRLTLDFSPIITDVRGLTVNVVFLVVQDDYLPDAVFYFDDVSLIATVPGTTPPPSWGLMDVCVPAENPPFAYINQPWDWVEGAVTPDSQVNATLSRGVSTISTASTTADTGGWFSLEFENDGVHEDILPGDDVILSGGGLDETITVVDIVGWIDVAGDAVGGIGSGSTFDVWGDVCVRQPFDPLFISKEAYFDAEGRFDVDFSGVVDIEYDYIAQVVYPDPNGNFVVQVFYPEGLDLNVLIDEDRIEGVTTPGEEVNVSVWNDQGEKGSAITTADDTGFYSTAVFNNGNLVDIVLGDYVGVSNSGHAREAFVTLSHESWIIPWINRVEGKVQGVDLEPSGKQGRVDLWSMSEGKWYPKYVWIESDGSYGADFDELPEEMSPIDRIRLWVSDGDGYQQASFGSNLEVGVSLGNSEVWGHTIAGSIVNIILFRGEDSEGNPIDVLGDGGVRVDSTGNFTTTVMMNEQTVGVSPGNILQVNVSFEYNMETIEFSKLFFIGNVALSGDSEQDILSIFGPANADVHVEGFRTQTTTSESYYWVQEMLGEDGQAEIDMSSEDILEEDIFKVTAYMSDDGISIERLTALYSDSRGVFLPFISR